MSATPTESYPAAVAFAGSILALAWKIQKAFDDRIASHVTPLETRNKHLEAAIVEAINAVSTATESVPSDATEARKMLASVRTQLQRAVNE